MQIKRKVHHLVQGQRCPGGVLYGEHALPELVSKYGVPPPKKKSDFPVEAANQRRDCGELS